MGHRQHIGNEPTRLKFSEKENLELDTVLTQIDDGTIFYHESRDGGHKVYVKWKGQEVHARLPATTITRLIPHGNSVFFLAQGRLDVWGLYRSSFCPPNMIICSHIRDLEKDEERTNDSVLTISKERECYAYNIYENLEDAVDIFAAAEGLETRLECIHKGTAFFVERLPDVEQHCSHSDEGLPQVKVLSKSVVVIKWGMCRMIRHAESPFLFMWNNGHMVYVLDTRTMQIVKQFVLNMGNPEFWTFVGVHNGVAMITAIYYQKKMIYYFERPKMLTAFVPNMMEDIQASANKMSSAVLEVGDRDGTSDNVRKMLKADEMPSFNSTFLNEYESCSILRVFTIGCVFKAYHRMDKAIYAVKRIHLREEDVEDALTEVRVLASLKHEGIIGYNHTWEERPPSGWQKEKDCELLGGHTKPLFGSDRTVFIYIKMEYYSQSLEHWLDQDNTRDPDHAKTWFKQLVSAVDYIHCHEDRLFHRDLKPSNILVTNENRLKIGDLGSVATQNDKNVRKNGAGGNWWETVLVGTRLYMAPEQFTNDYGSKVDVFALGLILVEQSVKLTSRETQITFNGYRRGKLQPPTPMLEHLPDVDEFVSFLTQKDPNDRPNCKQILQHQFLTAPEESAKETINDYKSTFHIDYEVRSLLGEGVFGCVFKAYHPRDESIYAVKRIHTREIDVNDALAEVRVLAKLNHCGIVQYLHTWEEYPPDGWQKKKDSECLRKLKPNRTEPLRGSEYSAFIYIKMEYCYQSLGKWLIDNDDRDPGHAKTWFKQLVSAVDYIHCHEDKLVHRDLKPNNILVTTDNCLKICDLGLVTTRGDEDVTRTWKCGTPLYMAPEQFSSKYGNKVDIYALGLILIELFVRFIDKQTHPIFLSYQRGELQPPTPSLQHLPEVDEFVSWLTQMDPKLRPNCKQILQHPFLS